MLTYLLLDLLSVAVPLLFSFHKRLGFYRTWYAFWPAAFTTAAIFIVWDVAFTQRGVWGFNPHYLVGIEWFNLPLEEWLFFICIPYACVFTYACLKTLVKRDYCESRTRSSTWVLAGALMLVGVLNLDRAYTSSSFIATGLLLLAHLLVFKSSYLGKFYLAYVILLLPFLLVNGILTGSFLAEEVVWYNDEENLALRIFTIPVEDFVYALLLVLLNVTIYEMLIARKTQNRSRREQTKDKRILE
ncbi:MAG: lycopene cyclase domain-containing protein [candidate division KSB1 bacterium]